MHFSLPFRLRQLSQLAYICDMETNWQPMTEEAWYAALSEVPAPPSCEFCGDTEDLVNDPTPHVPTLCLFCSCEVMAQVYPELVANVGAAVARTAGRIA